jgi:hypothetical protein
MDLNAELRQKMHEEQQRYKEYLCTLPAMEILDHAYEINLREDILMVMDTAYLSNKQAKVLLESPTPLADVYRSVGKNEPGHIGSIRNDIRAIADAIIKQEEVKMRDIPVYMESPAYALQHEEAEQYGASHEANVACRDAIQDAIRKNYNDNSLDVSCAKQIVERFGLPRTQIVLASTIRAIEWDGRISNENKAWARKVRIPDEVGREYHVRDCHPGLTDLFCRAVRKMGARERQKSMSYEAR